jgi:hypothetical protein
VNLIVGDAQDAIPSGDENRVSLGVCLSLLVVDCAVHFDNEASGVAVEVYDEAAEYVLASDVQVVEAMMSQTIP